MRGEPLTVQAYFRLVLSLRRQFFTYLPPLKVFIPLLPLKSIFLMKLTKLSLVKVKISQKLDVHWIYSLTFYSSNNRYRERGGGGGWWCRCSLPTQYLSLKKVQNMCDQITSDRTSKCLWSDCVLCVPFIFSGSSNECGLQRVLCMYRACVTTAASLVTCNIREL